MAAESGLRAAEIHSLKVSFFDFGESPTETVPATKTKKRQDVTIPLRLETAAQLQALCVGKRA